MAFRNLPEMPCGPILELHGQRKRFHVPYGLKNLLEDMTREVLRHQPENIYEYLAKFMESRGKKKKTEQAKKEKTGRKSWQEQHMPGRTSVLSPEDLKDFLESLGPISQEAEKHAVVIQSAFRGYQARKMVNEIKKSVDPSHFHKSMDAATKRLSVAIGQGRLSISSRKSRSSRKSILEISSDNATEDEQHAAVTIQSAFRGMQARKEVKQRKSILEEHRHSMMEARAHSKSHPGFDSEGYATPFLFDEEGDDDELEGMMGYHQEHVEEAHNTDREGSPNSPAEDTDTGPHEHSGTPEAETTPNSALAPEESHAVEESQDAAPKTAETEGETQHEEEETPPEKKETPPAE